MLPGIVPRLHAFAADGFSWIAYLMAILYAAVGLLPANHPYLNGSNQGRYGVRHVILEAGRRLKFDRNHIDQVIIYLTLLTGFVLLLAQIVVLVLGFIHNPVMAAPPFLSLFETPAPVDNDIAYMLLDRVFAVPDLYGSQFDPAIAGMTPFSNGLHELFSFYSQAMLIVGVFILLYYVVILVAETAQTGTPFGQRFESIWAPIRLVVAIGLLVPVNYGYNSAQYIVLYAAKFGSSFATNGWNVYNDTIAGAGVGCGTGGASNATGVCDENLIAVPRSQDVMHLIQFMSIARSCKLAYDTIYRTNEWPAGTAFPMNIQPYMVRTGAGGAQEYRLVTGGPTPTWDDAVEFYGYNDILIVFGEHSTRHDKDTGNVRPFCGELLLPVTTADPAQTGPRAIQNMYYAMVMTMWDDPRFQEFATKANAMWIPEYMNQYGGPCTQAISLGDTGPCANGRRQDFPSPEFGQTLKSAYFATSQAILVAGRQTMINDINYTVTAEMLERGWAGAGIWYNQIAEWNGSLFAAAINIPSPKSLPLVMKEIESQKSGTDQNVKACERYEPYLAMKDRVGTIKLDPQEAPVGDMFHDIYKYWRCDNPTEKLDNKPSGNVIFDTLSAIFGLNGLFTIRENPTTHPMAQLSAIGRSIVESAIGNLMKAMAFSFMGGMVEILEPHQGGAFHALSSMFVTFTTMGLSVGFILYYVLPFLPFMYFYFAVGSWIKAIFEAMVGVPLWALAHLRLGGHGLPGDKALNGYFLIFEIFVRPILTVFGLLAGMAIFAAMVKALNGIFPLVTMNLTGFENDAPKVKGVIQGQTFRRAVVDEFFFTLIYTVIVYMIALSSFKMIDLVPNNILRWMGGGVQAFNSGDTQGSMEQFIQYAALRGSAMVGQAAGATTSATRVGGNIGGMVIKAVTPQGRAGGQGTGTPQTPPPGNNPPNQNNS